MSPQTGEEIWRVRYEGYSVVPRPVFGHGLVYLSTSFDSSQLLAIRPDGHGDVTESHVAWKQTRSMPYTPSPLLIGENLFVISDAGIASCLDAKTGKPHWTHRVGGKFSASPFVAEDHVYILSESGDTTIFQATPEKYIEVARNKLDEPALASAAVVDRGLLICTAASAVPHRKLSVLSRSKCGRSTGQAPGRNQCVSERHPRVVRLSRRKSR